MFQALTKLMTAIVARAGAVIGSTILQMISGSRAPSTIAASSIS